jgi:hypothetical protein
VHLYSAGAARVWIEQCLSNPPWSGLAHFSTRFAALQSTLSEVTRCLSHGLPCHLAVLTAETARTLQQDWPDQVELLGSLGHAATGWVVLANDQRTYDISTPEAMSQTLRDLDVLLVPDFYASSGGRHLGHVLQQLKLSRDEIRAMHSFTGGAQAVAALKDHKGSQVMACAQSTEIQGTDHARYLGPFPAPHGLSTEYAVVQVHATPEFETSWYRQSSELAHRLGQFLCGSELRRQREQLGFT